VCTAKLNTRNHPFCPEAVLLYLMRGAQTWREEGFPVVSGPRADIGIPSLAHFMRATGRARRIRHVAASGSRHPSRTERRIGTRSRLPAIKPAMGLGVRILTFPTLLQEFTMDIGSFPLFVSYLDSPHPFGSCSRLVPDGCALDSLNRIPPGTRSEQGPKPLACATTRRPHGLCTMRSSRVLGKEAPASLQT
jgi:hypothetical protein